MMDPKKIRSRIIGLEDFSAHGSYFPELQTRIQELEENKHRLEEKSAALINILDDLEEARASLQESEAKFRTLFEYISSGILMVERRSLGIHLANRAACRMLDSTSAGLDGKSFISIVAADQGEILPGILESGTAKDRESIPVQTVFLTEGGRKIPVEAQPSSVEIAGKQYILIAFTDISQRLAAEEIIRANAERLRVMFAISEEAGDFSEDEIIEAGLEVAVRITGSKIGYLQFLSDDLSRVTRTIWSEAVREKFVGLGSHASISANGLWAECIRRGKPIVVNDPNVSKRTDPIPESHLELARHMVAPVIQDRKTVVLVGVANKSADYTQNDELQLRIVAEDIWNIVERRRAENEREFDHRWQQLISDIATNFNLIIPGEYPEAFTQAIGRLGEFVRAEAGVVYRASTADHFELLGSWSAVPTADTAAEIAFEQIPYLISRFREGSVLCYCQSEDFPREVVGELEGCFASEIRSLLAFPLVAAGRMIGAVILTNRTRTIEWDSRLPERLKLVSELFVHTLNRMAADELLRLSEERFRRLAENASDIIFRIRLAPPIVFDYVSPVVHQITGYDQDEIYSDIDIIERLIHPEDHSLIPILQQGNLASGAPVVMRWVRKDGGVIWVELRHSLVHDDHGKVAAVEGIIRDITARKADEAELRKSKEENELLVEAGRKLSSTLDLKLIYTSLYEMVSQVMPCSELTVSAYAPDRRMLRCVYGIRNGESIDTDRVPPMIVDSDGEGEESRVLRTGKPLIHNEIQQPANGLLETVHAGPAFNRNQETGSLLLVPIVLEGQVVGLVRVSGRDHPGYTTENLRTLEALTLQMAAAMHNASLYERAQSEVHERRKAEEALRQANLVVERSPVMLFRWRQEPGWPVALVSKNIIQLGYSADDFLTGKLVYADIMLPEDIERIRVEHRGNLAAGKANFQLEYRIITRDGRIRWVEDRSNIVRDADGNLLYREGIVIDVTERKEAELALKENVFRFKAIINHHYQLTALMDPEGILLAVNNSALRFANVSEAEVLGKPFCEGPWWAHSQEMREKVVQSIQRARNGSFVRYETTNIDGNGVIHDIDFSLNPILDENGSVIYLVPEGRDITEYRQAVAAAEQLNARLRRLYDLGLALAQTLELERVYQIAYEHVARLVDAPYFAISLFDANTNRLEMEYPVVNDVPRSKTDFPAITFDRRQKPKGRLKAIRSARPEIINHLRERARIEVPRGEAVIISYDGDDRAPDTALYVPMIFGGSVIGLLEVQSYASNAYSQEQATLLGSIANQVALAIERARLYDQVRRELDERRRAEAALRDSEERLRLAISAGKQGLFDWDIINNQLKTNDEYLWMLGYDPETVSIQQGWWQDHLHPEDRERVGGYLDRYVRGEEDEYHVEFRMRTADGQWRWIDSVGEIVAWDADGHPERLLGTHSDITLRKQHEEQMRDSLAEKEVLLREIHHRVKNNLEVIISLAELQSRGITDPVSKDYLREFQERVRTIALVHENLYRSENIASIDAQQYLQKLANNLFQAFGPPGVEVMVSAERVTLTVEKAIPCGLIVTELVTNAFKHAFLAGQRLTDGKVWIELEQDGDDLVLTVRDNGVGLPEEIDWRHKKSLGLRLIDRLAGQLHGSVKVETGEGACFRITFPNPGAERTV